MIRNTFSILNGIGERTERRLWGNGILTWDDFINAPDIEVLSDRKKDSCDAYLTSATKELQNSNAKYFAQTVKRREHWRFFDIFKGEAVCLDIETNGLMPNNGGYVTLIGLYNGFDYTCLISGINLSPEHLMEALSGYKYLITFYGSIFDIPFLLRSMPGLNFDIPHFDICFGARKTGFKGGLKSLEADLGIRRDESVQGMNGYDAVILWEYARQGDSKALELLKIYNKEDTVNLLKIAETIYQRLRTQTGIDEYTCCRHI
jgi:uncharacterized protein